MNILQVNTLDTYGGAARIAWTLHTAYRENGYNSWMFVGTKFGDDPYIFLMPDSNSFHLIRSLLYNVGERLEKYHIEFGGKKPGRFFQRLSTSQPIHSWNSFWGIEDFEYSGTWKILKTLENKVDIVHLHNLHGNYFDLRFLPSLSYQRPVLLTLHDAWLLSGHCAHSLDCEKWKIGCGGCPYLNVSPPINRDSTALSWRRKKRIYSNSQIYVASPSQWLINKVNDHKSILRPAVVLSRVIPNGVDLSVFRPVKKAEVRSDLHISDDAVVLLFVAVGSKDNLSKNNLYKDYKTIYAALETVSNQHNEKNIVFLALGGDQEESYIGNTLIKFVPYVNEPKEIAKYYQAADIYLHAAHAETFPNVILEALACGVPVIATNVGGISEQVKNGLTGFLVNKFDFQAMSMRILELLENDELRKKMARNASDNAKSLFGLERMVESYLSYYQEIILDWQSRNIG